MEFIMFFFKQKTAYDMRIRDWSSDVCSSDLLERADAVDQPAAGLHPRRRAFEKGGLHLGQRRDFGWPNPVEHVWMAAENTGRRTGRIEQHMIETAFGLPPRHVGFDQFGGHAGALHILAKSRQKNEKAPG